MALSATERLNLVAQSETVNTFIVRSRIFLLLFAPLCLLLAINSTASLRETRLVAVVGGLALRTAIVAWLNWRYKVYALALFWFLLTICELLSHDLPSSKTAVRWFMSHALALAFLYYSWQVWLRAKPYALANSDNFLDTRNQFSKWRSALYGGNTVDVVEFSAGDFLTGYWTYRILNGGTCWVVAQFKRGTTRLKSCRVYDLSSVRFTRSPSGRCQITITPKSGEYKSFDDVEVPLSFPISVQVL